MGANAQTTVPSFTAGQVLTAAQLNNSARTGVPVFATTSDRDAAFDGTGEKTLAEGQLCYIEAAPNSLQYYTGTVWVPVNLEWQTWTPVWTNFTPGNATIVAKYAQVGKTVFGFLRVTWGSTTSTGSNPNFTLPTTVNSDNQQAVLGHCNYQDTGTANYLGMLVNNNTTNAVFNVMIVNATFPTFAGVTSTQPHTWANTDVMTTQFWYEAA